MEFHDMIAQFTESRGVLPVHNIQIATDSDLFIGAGALVFEGDELVLDVALNDETPLPQLRGSFNADQFWTISGIIQSRIPFWFRGLPRGHSFESGRYRVLGARFSVRKLHHLLGSPDLPDLAGAALQASKESTEQNLITSAEALVRDFKIAWWNGGTENLIDNTFLGQSSNSTLDTFNSKYGDFNYALIQTGSNCRIIVQKDADKDPAAGELQRVYTALLEAVAFAHGKHVWPDWQVRKISGNTVDEWFMFKKACRMASFQL